MKTPKHVEEKITCDECHKEITRTHWYRIWSNELYDFCSTEHAIKFRDSLFRVIEHDEYPRVMGNTD